MNKCGEQCEFSGCERLITKKSARGYCPLHYRRLQIHGDPSVKLQGGPKKVIGICSVDGCKKELLQKGYCQAHYMKWWRHGDPLFTMPPARGRTPTVMSWQAMKRRCTDSNVHGYHRYGGRGITYDPKWESYDGFVGDMGERPEGTTLDRIDNDGNYNKDNCRWATPLEQMNNIRTNHIISYNGVEKTLSQWAREYDLLPKTLAERIRVGWTVERAFTTPTRK